MSIDKPTMVNRLKDFNFNISYVRINPGKPASIAVKGWITKGMSGSDRRVINAQLTRDIPLTVPVKTPIDSTLFWGNINEFPLIDIRDR